MYCGTVESKVISDNGKGLDPGTNISQSQGLGLKLMRGLTEDDMEGKFSIKNDKGITITVSFVVDNIIRKDKNVNT